MTRQNLKKKKGPSDGYKVCSENGTFDAARDETRNENTNE